MRTPKLLNTLMSFSADINCSFFRKKCCKVHLAHPDTEIQCSFLKDKMIADWILLNAIILIIYAVHLIYTAQRLLHPAYF